MWFVVGVLGFFFVLTVILTGTEFRKITPLAFLCQRCGNEFRQAPHKDYPRLCPRCRAADWAV